MLPDATDGTLQCLSVAPDGSLADDDSLNPYRVTGASAGECSSHNDLGRLSRCGHGWVVCPSPRWHLDPTSREKPQRALAAALIISVFIHGLAHYPQSISDPFSAIIVTLMYGIPLGLIYIKRDYESAVAYHFFIDFVRFAFTVSLVN